MRPESCLDLPCSERRVVRSVDGAQGHGVQDSCVTGRERQTYTCASVRSETRTPGRPADRRSSATGFGGRRHGSPLSRIVAPDLGPLWPRSNDLPADSRAQLNPSITLRPCRTIP